MYKNTVAHIAIWRIEKGKGRTIDGADKRRSVWDLESTEQQNNSVIELLSSFDYVLPSSKQ